MDLMSSSPPRTDTVPPALLTRSILALASLCEPPCALILYVPSAGNASSTRIAGYSNVLSSLILVVPQYVTTTQSSTLPAGVSNLSCRGSLGCVPVPLSSMASPAA
ncbi:MAG: hypothetical protein EB833_06810, partial [Thaumarchaeota archaeon S13]